MKFSQIDKKLSVRLDRDMFPGMTLVSVFILCCNTFVHWLTYAFVVLGVVSSVLSQVTGHEERLQHQLASNSTQNQLNTQQAILMKNRAMHFPWYNWLPMTARQPITKSAVNG